MMASATFPMSARLVIGLDYLIYSIYNTPMHIFLGIVAIIVTIAWIGRYQRQMSDLDSR